MPSLLDWFKEFTDQGVGKVLSSIQGMTDLYNQRMNGYEENNPIWQMIKGYYGYGSQYHPVNVELADRLKQLLEAGDYKAIQGIVASQGGFVNSSYTDWLNNMIASQNNAEARNWEEYVAQNSTNWLGDQLTNLGLSTSGVLQMGINGTNPVGPANNTFHNPTQRMAELKYQQRMAIAKQLLSMTSQMASAGVYGSAIGAARRASATIGSQAAHSARMVTTYDANDHRTGRSISETLPENFDFSQLF